MAAIRWIGAFGHASDLASSLEWELTQHDREVAAEIVHGGQGTITHARIGLLVDKGAVIRAFPGDVWSVTREGGRLEATRQATGWHKNHTEAFCRPEYAAIVLKDHPARFRPSVLKAVKDAAEKHGLPVIMLARNGKRTRISLQGGRQAMK